MRQKINSIILVALALVAFQVNLFAQTEKVVYQHSFADGWGDWTVDSNIPFCWALSGDFLQANGYMSTGTTYATSPAIKLDANGNEVEFNHKGWYFGSFQDEAKLVIKEQGGEWVAIEGVTYPTNYDLISSGRLAIPAEFNGKEVFLGFQYMNPNGVSVGDWYIKDIQVTAAGSAEPEQTKKTLFLKTSEELFNSTFNGFTIEGYLGLNDWESLWNFGQWGGPHGAKPQYIADGDTDIESYFVTPVIRLHKENSIKITHTVIGYAEGDASNHLSLCIREAETEGWETIEGVQFFADNVEGSTEVNIDSKYTDKKVQFGFRYTAADKATAGTWLLSEIGVYGMAPDPVEAGFFYDVTEVKYEIGSKDPFKAPVLNNPNGVAVKYQTSDYDIANVDSNTGEVTIGGNKQGVVTITARSEESIEFLAGEASYTIEVVDPILVFKASFSNDEGGFTEESSSSSVWKFNWGNVAAQNPVESATTSYYVSPEMKLPAEGTVVSFNHAAQGIANIQEHAGFCIREVGGEWAEIAIENWPAEDTFWWDFISTGDITVPAAYNGKNVQFGFRFTLDETTFAENVGNDWPNTKYAINSFLVTKYIERAEAGLSFDKAEYTYYIGEIPFESPVVNNPNELQVQYSIDFENSDVISVDAESGEVTILDEGKAAVYAKSTINLEYLAGEASYVLNVIDPSLVFRHKFGKDGFGEFTQEGSEGLWSFDGYVNTGACTNENLETGARGYLVSPVITLGENGNKASWKENGYACDFATQALFAVREVGGEWTEITAINRADENNGGMTDAFCEIPAQFNGKEVQVAFLFIQSEPNNWQSWNINDLRIRKEFVRIDPALAFDVAEASYVKGEEFTAPVLSNPENVAVVYSSSDVLVATVDELTGELEFIGEGATVITVTSEENNKYLPGEASYNLTVSFTPVGIEGVTIHPEKAEIYDLQGRRVKNVIEGNIYIVNGKKVLISK